MVQGFLRIAIFLGISSQCDLVETKRASYVTKKLRFEIHDASFIHNSKCMGPLVNAKVDPVRILPL